jgi:flagellar motor switch protein FliN
MKGQACLRDSLQAQALRCRSTTVAGTRQARMPLAATLRKHRRSLFRALNMPDPTESPSPEGASTRPLPVGLPDFSNPSPHSTDASGIGVLGDVSLQVRIELGRTKMLVEDVLKLNADSVVELDKAAGDPVDIYVNGRRIARGEVLVLNENFCVRVSEILEPYEA